MYPDELRGQVCVRKPDRISRIKQKIHPMVIVSMISRQHSHQKYDMIEEFTWVNFPPTSKKNRFCFLKPETRLGSIHSLPLSLGHVFVVRKEARPILLEKWMAYCNGKAPSQQAGNPLHSCENGRLVKTWRMGS